ncbi:hypothetical protein [Bordetella avium]|uniref:hypothetical protein n=1 Tax=Bordetella avium TaxID=521 RepID=UPI000E691AED|nr:hypothetical protein [Bordetella avium]RIQ51025.1 hypothetical protein D0843_11070 [Bordetella avium]
MTKINDGGPAFPFAEQDTTHSISPGMTLRDYFAAKALPVVASASHTANSDYLNVRHYDSAAEDAYAMADAMLAARERQQP